MIFHENHLPADDSHEKACLRTSDTLIGYLPIFQLLPKTPLYI